MKAKAFFQRLNKQGKISNDEANAIFEKLPEELEIPDVWVNMFEENFLTRERAASDFELTKKIKAETLNGVDEKIKGFLPLLDPTDREAIEKEINTYKKVESIPGFLQKVLEKAKTANPSNDEKIKEYEKTVKERDEMIANLKQTFSSEKETLQKQFTDRERTMKVDWSLQNKFGEFIFADEFSKPEDKKAIIELISSKVKSGNALDLDDKGQIVVQEIVNGVPKQKYNGNDPVTIDSLLAEPLKPFLKKNNGDGSGATTKPTTTTTQRTTTTRTVAPTIDNTAAQSNLDRRRSAKQNTPVS
jgi:hypothetical protein